MIDDPYEKTLTDVTTEQEGQVQVHPDISNNTPEIPSTSSKTTRSGRHVRFPVRYNDMVSTKIM